MSGGTTSGTRGEQLAELDERRPELVEHLAQVPAPLGSHRRSRVGLDPRRPRKDVGQLVPLEEVAEAVADRDLSDLGETADLARARTCCHGCSVPRDGRESHPRRCHRGRRHRHAPRRPRAGGKHRRRARGCPHRVARPRRVPRDRNVAGLGWSGRDRVRRREARARGRDRRARVDPLRGRAPDLVAAPPAGGRAGGASEHGRRRRERGAHRRRGVRALRADVARVRAARRRGRVDGRRRRLRDAPLHAHPAPAGAHARGGVGRQRPDGDRPDARPDRLDREAPVVRLRRPLGADRAADRARAPGRRRARAGRVVGVRAGAPLDRRVRSGGIGRRRRALLRRRRRDRRQRLPRRLPRRPRRRQHAVSLPPPAGRLPRRARVPGAGRALHRARPARLPVRTCPTSPCPVSRWRCC